jgi:hypothetical protein
VQASAHVWSVLFVSFTNLVRLGQRLERATNQGEMPNIELFDTRPNHFVSKHLYGSVRSAFFRY